MKATKAFQRNDKVTVMLGCRPHGCPDGELRPGMPALILKVNHAFGGEQGHSCALGCVTVGWGVALSYFDPATDSSKIVFTCYRNLIRLEE